MKNSIQNTVKTVFVLCSFFFSLNSNAQAPQKMSYQAVIRNASNTLVANATVGIKISILQTTATGTAVFEESHTPTINANGLATLEIGGGTVISGSFAAIDWSAGPYFIKTETDPAGGTNYTIAGTSQLLSVPYALNATNGGKVETTNTAFGKNSLATNTGLYNTSVGVNSLQFSTTGGSNTAVGVNSLQGNFTGSSNTAIGVNALVSNTTGIWNTAIGEGALYGSSGNSNIAIGGLALDGITTGANNLGIGNNSAVPIATGSNQMSIKNVIYGIDMSTTALGKIGIGTTTPTTKLEVNGFTKLGTNAPAIKILKITGTTSFADGGSYSYVHGLDFAKILSVNVLVEQNPNIYIPPSYYGYGTGYQYSFIVSNSVVEILNTPGNSGAILSKPLKIFITYEE